MKIHLQVLQNCDQIPFLNNHNYKMSSTLLNNFTQPLLHWHDIHGRKNLPWKHPIDAYRVWLSEIMLQQTQVKTVIPYFLKFVERCPDIQTLAEASEDDILALWSGLGYYSRGRHLHKTANIIYQEYGGQFPDDIQTLCQFPGIGPSTAAAIASQAFGQPTPILDGNVKRVLSRYFLIPGLSSHTTNALWQLAHQCMSHERPADYTQAIMDLGATCCTAKKPRCPECPLQSTCLAHINGLTADYPSKKPKKTLPKHYQQFLLMHTQEGLVYLEKRPSTGIWGGLWCPPTIDATACPEQHIKNTYSFNISEIKPLMQMKHTFTHFQLYISAILIKVEMNQHPENKLSGHWFSAPETFKLGLSKPVRDICRTYEKLVC